MLHTVLDNVLRRIATPDLRPSPACRTLSTEKKVGRKFTIIDWKLCFQNKLPSLSSTFLQGTL